MLVNVLGSSRSAAIILLFDRDVIAQKGAFSAKCYVLEGIYAVAEELNLFIEQVKEPLFIKYLKCVET